jgi:hexokinase
MKPKPVQRRAPQSSAAKPVKTAPSSNQAAPAALPSAHSFKPAGRAEQEAKISNVVNALRLDDAKLFEVRDLFQARIAEGLGADGKEIPAIPAFLPPPPDGLKGEAFASDWGGTNLRGALVRLGDKPEIVGSLHEARFRTLKLTEEQAFGLQASLLAKTGSKSALGIGQVFSFPAKTVYQRGNKNLDAVLERWTKDLDIPGVEGQPVGAKAVAAAQKQGVNATHAVVLNDTVAALLGGSALKTSHRERTIGLIAGTGTNMAGFFSEAQAPKLSEHGWDRPMAVNLESACFNPPYLTEYDDQVDAGAQFHRFEKAVSGHYLPYVFQTILPDYPGFDPENGSVQLVQIRENGTPEGKKVASALLDRSADLIAVGLAAVARNYPEGEAPITILAEGSLFWKTPGYKERVEKRLAQMLGPNRTAEIRFVEHVNLIGSATALLSHTAAVATE